MYIYIYIYIYKERSSYVDKKYLMPFEYVGIKTKITDVEHCGNSPIKSNGKLPIESGSSQMKIYIRSRAFDYPANKLKETA